MHAELYRSCCGVTACWACWLLNELLHHNYAEASAGKLACRLLLIFYKSPRAEFYGDAGRIYVVKMSMHSRIFFCFRVACRIQLFVHPTRLDHDWFMWDSRSRSLLAEILHAQFYSEFGQPFLTILKAIHLSHRHPRSFCTFQFRFGFVALSGFIYIYIFISISLHLHLDYILNLHLQLSLYCIFYKT